MENANSRNIHSLVSNRSILFFFSEWEADLNFVRNLRDGWRELLYFSKSLRGSLRLNFEKNPKEKT